MCSAECNLNVLFCFYSSGPILGQDLGHREGEDASLIPEAGQGLGVAAEVQGDHTQEAHQDHAPGL